jgi:hypothetical protein
MALVVVVAVAAKYFGEIEHVPVFLEQTCVGREIMKQADSGAEAVGWELESVVERWLSGQ